MAFGEFGTNPFSNTLILLLAKKNSPLWLHYFQLVLTNRIKFQINTKGNFQKAMLIFINVLATPIML